MAARILRFFELITASRRQCDRENYLFQTFNNSNERSDKLYFQINNFNPKLLLNFNDMMNKRKDPEEKESIFFRK